MIDGHFPKLFWPFEQPPLSIGRFPCLGRGIGQVINRLSRELLRPLGLLCGSGAGSLAAAQPQLDQSADGLGAGQFL